MRTSQEAGLKLECFLSIAVKMASSRGGDRPSVPVVGSGSTCNSLFLVKKGLKQIWQDVNMHFFLLIDNLRYILSMWGSGKNLLNTSWL
jgi:hypothetical protein